MDYNEDRWGSLFMDDETRETTSMTQDFLQNRRANVVAKAKGISGKILFQNIGIQFKYLYTTFGLLRRSSRSGKFCLPLSNIKKGDY